MLEEVAAIVDTLSPERAAAKVATIDAEIDAFLRDVPPGKWGESADQFTRDLFAYLFSRRAKGLRALPIDWREQLDRPLPRRQL